MPFPDRFRIAGDPRRTHAAGAPLSCDRGGPVQKIDDVLAELIDQYRARFPELRLAVVKTRAEVW